MKLPKRSRRSTRSMPTTRASSATGVSAAAPCASSFVLQRKRCTDYAAVTFMDEQVGRVVDHVEELGQTDKTIVIFHGDQYAPCMRAHRCRPSRQPRAQRLASWGAGSVDQEDMFRAGHAGMPPARATASCLWILLISSRCGAGAADHRGAPHGCIAWQGDAQDGRARRR